MSENRATNICGVLVHALPDRLAHVRAQLAEIAGVEVHEVADGARLVVTLEDQPENPAIDQLSAIHRVEGVVAAALVYHHFEPAAQAAVAE
ncbi:MAG: chaperone NapD [Hyphomicrobiaceae bacterium]|nr:chaperone NapD [Hyphomicrobiaceae bacterium]